MSTCGKCSGTGQIRSVEYDPQWVACDSCNGSGNAPSKYADVNDRAKIEQLQRDNEHYRTAMLLIAPTEAGLLEEKLQLQRELERSEYAREMHLGYQERLERELAIYKTLMLNNDDGSQLINDNMRLERELAAMSVNAQRVARLRKAIERIQCIGHPDPHSTIREIRAICSEALKDA